MSDTFWLILGMMAVTFGVRYPVLALVGRMRLPRGVLQVLRFVPVAVLTAIISPATLMPQGTLAVSYANPYLLAAFVAVLVAARWRHLLPTILAGMATFALCKAFL